MRFQAQPRTGRIFDRSIVSDEWYLWDNYGYSDSGVIHVYAQAADKKTCASQEERYWSAYWRHFVSDDGGLTWSDEGPALCPGDEPEAHDSYTIWSGSVLKCGDGTVMAAYTGLQSGALALQSIAVAVSVDGYQFEKVSPAPPLLSVLHDYDELRSRGYYLGPRATIGNIEREADGTFLCFRDPFLFVDSDGQTHLFFGAKAARGKSAVNALGHAIFTDAAQMSAVEVLPPQHVPDAGEFNLLELPNIVVRDGVYYLIVSTSRLGHMGQPDLEAHKSVRIYRSGNLRGPWEPYGAEGTHILLRPESRLHGLNAINDSSSVDTTLACRAFWVGESWLPPSLKLRLGGDRPLLIRPEELWGDGE